MDQQQRSTLAREGDIMPTIDYVLLARSLEDITPKARIATDRLRTLSYGTDASFYRLIPRIVVTVQSEAEVIGVMACCAVAGAPVTFRAAGTSLSGQAITDSVLIVLGEGWQRSTVSDDGRLIALQPGIIGAEANRRLAPFAMPPACVAEPRRIHTRRCNPSASFWPTEPCSIPAVVTAEWRLQRLVPRSWPI
jgi:hypothetical protein